MRGSGTRTGSLPPGTALVQQIAHGRSCQKRFGHFLPSNLQHSRYAATRSQTPAPGSAQAALQRSRFSWCGNIKSCTRRDVENSRPAAPSHGPKHRLMPARTPADPMETATRRAGIRRSFTAQNPSDCACRCVSTRSACDQCSSTERPR